MGLYLSHPLCESAGMNFYAHSLEGRQEDKWEPLFTGSGDGHLEKVAQLASSFAREMFALGSTERESASEWGRLAGLWHDLGKFSVEFQKRLYGDAGRVDHSTAGAKMAASKTPYGPLLAYMIAGHHAGLPDGNSLFHERFKNALPEWESNACRFLSWEMEKLPLPPIARKMEMLDIAFTTRMLFSCLVDADFLATEAFMKPEEEKRRPKWTDDILCRMERALDAYYTNHFHTPRTQVEAIRCEVRKACLEKASLPPGFFSLTVPTGGGKTLASLSFALYHANIHGLRRVIYAIPYTSIIEQNADKFREVFADLSTEINQEIVLEHHSNFESKETSDPDQKPVWWMIVENWDAPLIATTNVQFLESLFANKTSRCRKLHNIAKSVIILDEAQAIPVRLVQPILQALKCLVHDFGCSVVFCTATQPALNKRESFPIGIPESNIMEIIPDPKKLQQGLRRVRTRDLGKLSDQELLDHLLPQSKDGALLVVNTTSAARELYGKITEHVAAFHLSARMCPAHRREILAEVTSLRSQNQPCVLISTQLIEAGVDISFPVVYRAECGIDSLAQAAGRCNRNGEFGIGDNAGGQVFYFQPTDHPLKPPLTDLMLSTGISQAHILGNFTDLLSLDAIEAFFQQAIWLQGGDNGKNWDRPGVLACFPATNSFSTLLFASAAEKFQMMPQITHPVLIPWGNEGQTLAKGLRDRDKMKSPPSLAYYREAQQFSVQVYDNEWPNILNKSEILHDDTFVILSNTQNDYDSHTGLKPGSSKSLLHVG